jgi:uncharacterized protein (DUF2147 family)
MLRGLCLFLIAGAAIAQAPRISPVGRWKAVNEVTGKATSIISIWEKDGRLYGKIEKLLNPNPRDPNPKCSLCPGDLKDQPLNGLQLLRDFHKDGDQWTGGRIVDPDSGKVYRCLLALEDGGKKLKVRGYIGFSMIGRTQYWYPEE